MVSFSEVSRTSYNEHDRPWSTYKVDADNVSEALIKAGLDWEVATEEVRTEHGVVIPNFRATVRTDLPAESPDRVLGIVGAKYQPIQNRDALGFVDSLLQKGARITHAGAFNGGKRVWVRTELQGEHGVNGDGYTRQLLGYTGHDGYCQRTLKAMMLRLVCLNGLMLMSDIGKWSVRHTKLADFRIGESDVWLSQAEHEWEKLTNQLQSLIGVVVDPKKYFEAVVPPTMVKNKETGLMLPAARGENIRSRIRDRLTRSPALEGHRSDLYGMFHAVTEYTDHDRIQNVKPANRLQNLWFGGADGMKQKALKTALAMVA